MNFLDKKLSEMRKDCYIQDKFVLIPNNVDKNEKPEIISTKYNNRSDTK